jgi:deoxyribonuclease V
LNRMKTLRLHDWQVSVSEAKEIQRNLAAGVARCGEVSDPRLIAGADISGEDAEGMVRAAVVVLRHPDLAVVDSSVVTLRPGVPYVPGLLSFREVPLLLSAFEGITAVPDVVIADAQGIAHPRRLGLASHLGLFLDVPTIGCAKSILCGRHGELGEEPGDHAPLIDGDEVVGVALRTKRGVRPVYVSIGQKVDLDTAIGWVVACCRGYRLPEPTRLAHLAAAGKLPSSLESAGLASKR